MVKKTMTLNRFYLIPERDRQTDGQICYINIVHQYMLMRDKKWTH